MLLNDFYKLNQVSSKGEGEKTKIIASIEINKSHHIFDGHFPDLPIVPGVCMVQIIKEIAERELDQTLTMTSASNIKFLTVINPQNHSKIDAEILMTPQKDGVDVDGKLFFEELTFFKIKAVFTSSLE